MLTKQQTDTHHFWLLAVVQALMATAEPTDVALLVTSTQKTAPVVDAV